MTGPVRWWLAAIAGGVALLTVACSGSSSTASGGSSSPAAAATTFSASSALCADAAALRTAMGKLTKIQASAGQGAVKEVRADLAEAKTAATNFANDAKGQWQPQTTSLKSALTSLQTEVQKLAANPTTAGVSSVVTALGQAATAAQQLLAAVGKDCPSGA
jgi:mannitol-1-phosphate/altronate dehydrogenase